LKSDHIKKLIDPLLNKKADMVIGDPHYSLNSPSTSILYALFPVNAHFGAAIFCHWSSRSATADLAPRHC
jgi:hypothetical protein